MLKPNEGFIFNFFILLCWAVLSGSSRGVSEVSGHLLRQSQGILTSNTLSLSPKVLLQGRVLLGQELYRVYLPFLQSICFMQLVEGPVHSSSLSSLWPAFVGDFDCLNFDPCPFFPFFPFLSLSWVLSFSKVWQGFITLLTIKTEASFYIKKFLHDTWWVSDGYHTKK